MEDIIFEAARLHYEEGLKQEEVARILGVSRPTAARYLALAKKLGYVRVRVLKPLSHGFLHETELALVQQFAGLREALVTTGRQEAMHSENPRAQQIAQRATVDELAERAGERLNALLTAHPKERQVVAVARGEMVDSVIRHLKPSKVLPNLEVLPMLGYLRSWEYPYDANRLAQELARIYGGNYEWIPAPAVVRPEQREVLGSLRLVQVPLEKLKHETTLVLTSISAPGYWDAAGQFHLRQSTLLQSQEIRESDVHRLVEEQGAVGEICGWYFSLEGLIEEVDWAIIGMGLRRLQEMVREGLTVIGVAGADPSRFDAIYAAVKLGLINVLVTDYLTARHLLEREA
ncbi:MAG TPA: hypothetical protein EYP85_09280 [Armatimonadetes bacterium]|nr:hypothetical protein [Armatimonadota bacterium]